MKSLYETNVEMAHGFFASTQHHFKKDFKACRFFFSNFLNGLESWMTK